MAPSRPAPLSGKNAILPWKSRFGNPICASSAENAPLFARMLSFARKYMNQLCLEDAPATFKSIDAKFKELPGMKFTIQVAPEDCTGCGLCVEACPAKDKTQVGRKAINMADSTSAARKRKRKLGLLPRACLKLTALHFNPTTVKNSQLLQPLFEFSGACAGCGETPYVKLVSQLFGDRTVDCQRHRMFLHLWRQPAHHPLGRQQAKAADQPGQTLCLKTMPNLVWACA